MGVMFGGVGWSVWEGFSEPSRKFDGNPIDGDLRLLVRPASDRSSANLKVFPESALVVVLLGIDVMVQDPEGSSLQLLRFQKPVYRSQEGRVAFQYFGDLQMIPAEAFFTRRLAASVELLRLGVATLPCDCIRDADIGIPCRVIHGRPTVGGQFGLEQVI